jgi:myo-inositol-1(or 4)-monophosphatase
VSAFDGRELATRVERIFRGIRPLVEEAFRRAPASETMKEDRTVVTDLDRRLEVRLGESLLALDPTWGLVGEEGGEIRTGRPTWHLDPLDGTLNFSRRLPVFGSQAVLLDGHDPLFAAVYEPLRDDFTWAARGLGTWREGRQVRVSSRDVREALMLVDVSRSGVLVRRAGLLPRLRDAVYRMRALGTVALQLRDVAVGVADAFFGSRRHPGHLHDLAPGILLVREAGGVVTDAEGRDPFEDRRSLLAAPPAVHAALLPIVAEGAAGS